MQQNREPQAVQLQPWDEDRQQVVREAEIEGRRYVRTARRKVPIPELHRKTLSRPLANQRRLFIRIFVEIEMGVIALDVGVGPRRARQPILLAGPHTLGPRGGFLKRVVSPRTLTFIGWWKYRNEALSVRRH